ncbi:hypothetical protein HYW17_05630 [Candidatus Uhrbacteria bacterium]|nr:hypothetical protein [Candidatus Uhrbacteria bacterium]
MMWLAILLILIITGVVWFLNKLLPFKLCPVCAGVSSTWITLSVLVLSGIIPTCPAPSLLWCGDSSFIIPISILMGGTVVGIAYQGEKSLHWVRRYPIAWKLAVMVVGFPLVYGAVQYMSWATLGVELVVLSGVVYVFFIRRGIHGEPHAPHRSDAQNVQNIEKGLEQCC